MRDVIQNMLDAEAEAKRITQAAEEEGERLRGEARAEIQALTDRSREETRNEADRIVATAVAEAERQRKDRIARAADRIEAEVRLDETLRRGAVEAVVRAVIGKS